MLRVSACGMLGDGDTVGKGNADSGVRLSSGKSPMKYGIYSLLVLMMVDESSSLVRLVGCCSTAMCIATSTRPSAVDGGLVFENTRLLTW
jgi:hypothetical protein